MKASISVICPSFKRARVKLSGGKGVLIDHFVGFWRQHEGGRVGTQKFRPDYIRSLVTAFDVILSGARAKGKCDRSLQRRLAEKLIIHALESGAHGNESLRRDCFLQEVTSIHGDPSFTFLINGIQLLPSWFDGMIWNRLVKPV
jgi:hypothetical protein